MEVKERIEKLRELMKENNMDAYIVPSFDDHHSEYVADHWKCRQWISGFTGSAGTAVITKDSAGLWTDGRYYIQAEKQISGSGMKLFRAADYGVPTYTEWLADALNENSCVGFDGNVFSVSMVKEMENEFKCKNISIKMDKDLIGKLWKDRPALPDSKAFSLQVKFAGKSRNDKLAQVRKHMEEKKAEYYLLTSLDDIAWLLNIRGNDVADTPVIISNVFITKENCYLFIDENKLVNKAKDELINDGIQIKNDNELEKMLEDIKEGTAVILDPEVTNAYLYSKINKKASKIEEDNYTTQLKGVKNDVEIENLRQCEINDGVAMVKFIKWLKSSIGKEKVTEISASDKLEVFRSQLDNYAGLSFDTIAGYKANAAMMHYKADKDSDTELKPEGFLLVDSGGQYYTGTTDITRTIVLGKLTEEEKRDFTLVLKSHIALGSAKFLYGTTGYKIDILARAPIWKYGLDYKCGTGHGVGYFLSVHEGPHRISSKGNEIILEENMVVTNEPGIYKEGKHGIRTENMIVVVKAEKNEFGQFMKFEDLTYCPIDLDAVDVNMLTADEKQWLNDYHKATYEKLSPYLNEEEKKWLANETRMI
ncbi:aminopeptidase P family protein [Clostridium oryzae]|uniref:Aminopeptidase n=1 Tax=Clostridium oryzae TaxID=1450648 RepID=A0A1V4IDT2_9CLOT|nr:aminopeptidase P family protein [Clostridium oryzae]OPJ58168.1 aminopeptidase [Clostridium oryzae]